MRMGSGLARRARTVLGGDTKGVLANWQWVAAPNIWDSGLLGACFL